MDPSDDFDRGQTRSCERTAIDTQWPVTHSVKLTLRLCEADGQPRLRFRSELDAKPHEP
jgi:hypothetical protein